VLKDTVFVRSTKQIKRKYHINSTIGDILDDPSAWEKLQKFLLELENRFSIPSYITAINRPENYLRNDCLRRMIFYYVRRGAYPEEVEKLFYKLIEDLNS